MLRIMRSSTATESRWTLCGQLAGQWVREFQADWERDLNPPGSGPRVIDLSDVTFIDESGEALLGELSDGGALLIAGSGVATRDLIESLKTNGYRPVRRLLRRTEKCR
ncbi:MAG TPA: hypothetical protein VNH18_28340 [Bryobacteraceae bacterium]|nr:hypothetical protein [Bryobacteraceae bacterium]